MRTSSLELLRQSVLRANQRLLLGGLVEHTWGNASAIDRERRVVVIKPSGVPFDALTADTMVVLALDGTKLDGLLRASSDTPTHLELYRRFPEIGGIAHTHSPMATAWAQAGRSIPVLGTTHADWFGGPVPCTRALTGAEIDGDYELATGEVIAETVDAASVASTPAVLVRGHGPFTWGDDAESAVRAAEALELVARIAATTIALDPSARGIDTVLARRHYDRKHGATAYYGQIAQDEG